MRASFKTITYPYGTYLVIEDDDGAEALLLMQDGELLSECLARYIRDEQAKRDIHSRRAARAGIWKAQILSGQSA